MGESKNKLKDQGKKWIPQGQIGTPIGVLLLPTPVNWAMCGGSQLPVPKRWAMRSVIIRTSYHSACCPTGHLESNGCCFCLAQISLVTNPDWNHTRNRILGDVALTERRWHSGPESYNAKPGKPNRASLVAETAFRLDFGTPNVAYFWLHNIFSSYKTQYVSYSYTHKPTTESRCLLSI